MVGRLFRIVFGVAHVVFLDFIPGLDPAKPANIQTQSYSNAYKLSRFLRLVRLPFLTLLVLPAVLPGFFIKLPRYAPVVKDIQKRIFWHVLGVTDPDVVESFPAYFYALAVWAAGVLAGVLLVKGFVKVSLLFHTSPQRRRSSVAVYVLATALIFGLMASYPIYDGRLLRESDGRPRTGFLSDFQGVAPGVAILALLGLLSLLNDLLRYFVTSRRWRLVTFVAGLVVIAWSNRALDSYRFENLDYSAPGDPGAGPFHYNLKARAWDAYLQNDEREQMAGKDVTPAAGQAACDPLLQDEATLDSWKAVCKGGPGSPGGKPKLVVVCTSGGAIRAGYWTATVLDRLGREVPSGGGAGAGFGGDFHSHVRLITGASGGMVGASYYVTWLRDRQGLGRLGEGAKERLDRDRWVLDIPIFSLRPVARFIALRASLLTVGRGLVNRLGYYPDRGRELEQDWPELRYPVSQLREFEGKGQLPSLVFSPMTVEDGRRLLVSNLDLGYLYNPDAPPRPSPPGELPLIRSSVLESEARPDALAPVSLTGLEFFKAFCPREKNDILLATAARMSATFPYVAPAVNLPSVPPLRVVDAGYYDNYGVDLASAWIFANRHWIKCYTSGVLIVQIRDALSLNDRLGYPDEPSGVYAWLFRGLQFFFSPLDGVISARTASTAFRNDALVAGLSDYFAETTKNREFLTTAIFELASRTVQPYRGVVWDWPSDRLDRKIQYADSSQSTEVAMSWYLSVAERQAIDSAIPYPERPPGFVESGKVPFGKGTKGKDLVAVLGLNVPDDKTKDYDVPEIDPKTFKASRPDRDARVGRIKDIRGLVKANTTLGSVVRDRALYVLDKEIARASNYERLREIQKWWGADHSAPSP